VRECGLDSTEQDGSCERSNEVYLKGGNSMASCAIRISAPLS
jgi:hypothetical protein